MFEIYIYIIFGHGTSSDTYSYSPFLGFFQPIIYEAPRKALLLQC